VWGEYPPVTDWDAHIEHRNAVALAISEHDSNGFQYGVDISGGNVECGHLLMVAGAPMVVVPDPETGLLPEGAQPATYCFYDSWR
jgi:hypothetical protein